MREKQQALPTRAIALLAALVLHAAPIGYALRMHPWRASAFTPETFMELYWFDPAKHNVSKTVPTSAEKRSVTAPTIRAIDTATSMQPITETAAEASRHIDWNAQAKDAAANVMQKQAERDRQESQFNLHPPLSGLVSKGKLDSGWREYRFRGHGRVETQSGVPILHLNDRCAMIAFLIPVCVLGKMKPGNEMYEHMKEWEKHRGEEELP